MIDDMEMMINSSVNEQVCFMFMPFNDFRVEDTECFFFDVSPDGNETFENGINTMQACILDDDGKLWHLSALYSSICSILFHSKIHQLLVAW